MELPISGWNTECSRGGAVGGPKYVDEVEDAWEEVLT